LLNPDLEDVHGDLVAGRYEAARYSVEHKPAIRQCPPSALTAIREGRFQDAICRIERELFTAHPWPTTAQRRYDAVMGRVGIAS